MSKRFTDAEIFCNGYQNAVSDIQRLMLRLRQNISESLSAHDILVKIDIELDKMRDYHRDGEHRE